jgi:hypothetical protein
MQKKQTIEDRHAENGASCAVHLDRDAQQPCCFFTSLLFTLLLFLIFKTLLLKSSFLFFKVSFLRHALSHVFLNLS